MPYVITTKRDHSDMSDRGNPSLTRRAVATLEEARLAVAEQLEDDALRLAEQPLATTGGTVGPLPDGTVIEVEQVSEAALHNAIRSTLCCPTCGIQQSHVSGSHLIDAYNAAQGT